MTDEMLQHNLAVLKSYGVHYVSNAQSRFSILKQYLNGEIDLSSEELHNLVEGGLSVTSEHMRILRMGDKERMTYKGMED